jgi:iron complex transport system ATP-binding protein
MILMAEGIEARYLGAPVSALAGVSVAVAEGELVAVVGPNGSGKTTLLRALLGTVPLAAGRVEILGRPLGDWEAAELARVIGVVTQREETLFPLTVTETVALGRYAHRAPLAAEREVDRLAIQQAMQRTDLTGLAGRRTDLLSGGEWQRVRIARALAQEPRLLVLDEPTISLDVRHEMEVFELVRALAGQGIATLLVTHHLNLAARFADRLLLFTGGRLAADGPPGHVLTADHIARVFDWPVAITTWGDALPQVIPLRPGERPGPGKN